MESIVRYFEQPEGSFFLFGPRGTGKSTWLKRRHSDALHIDLLDPATHRRLQARPERLEEQVLARQPSVVVLDEIQRVPELLSVVHRLIEAFPETAFVLTGSSARKLRRAGTNLLAGRAVVRGMHPFMAAELGDQFSLVEALETGLVPLVWAAEDRRDVRDSYIALYLREEVQAEAAVRNLAAFGRFLEAVSFSHGSVLNVASVARECEVGRKTVVGYLEVLEDLLLSYTVPVFTKRAKRATVVHPKFYLFDSGVFRSLRPAGPLDRPSEAEGPALEGLVAQHLRAWIDYGRQNVDLFFWRTRGGAEVDFIVYGEDGFVAIEVKNTSRVRNGDLRSLKTFATDYPEAEPILLYRGHEALVRSGIRCLPVEQFLRSLLPGTSLPA